MPEPLDAANRGRAVVGVALSLAAAATFGVLAPAAKGALAHVGPIRGAALAYLAAGCVALFALLFGKAAGLARRGRPLAWRDAPRLAGMALLGGALGPALFFADVERIAAHHAAVLQHLDGHHTHEHGPDFDPATEHVHEHDHEPFRRSHAHVHDEHHRHRQ